jgi:hypothetical protein
VYAGRVELGCGGLPGSGIGAVDCAEAMLAVPASARRMEKCLDISPTSAKQEPKLKPMRLPAWS